jgi:hypothetical protein
MKNPEELRRGKCRNAAWPNGHQIQPLTQKANFELAKMGILGMDWGEKVREIEKLKYQ